MADEGQQELAVGDDVGGVGQAVALDVGGGVRGIGPPVVAVGGEIVASAGAAGGARAATRVVGSAARATAAAGTSLGRSEAARSKAGRTAASVRRASRGSGRRAPSAGPRATGKRRAAPIGEPGFPRHVPLSRLPRVSALSTLAQIYAHAQTH